MMPPLKGQGRKYLPYHCSYLHRLRSAGLQHLNRRFKHLDELHDHGWRGTARRVTHTHPDRSGRDVRVYEYHLADQRRNI